MYNVDLRKKGCFYQANCRKRKTRFLLVSKHVNYLCRSLLSSNCIISYIAQTQYFRDSQIPQNQNWRSCCDNFVFQKVYLFKHVSQLLSLIWSVLLEYLHHFYVVISYGVFLRCLIFFFWCFSFVFIFGQNFNFSSNDTAVATAAVELNIRTIILLLLLTLKIVYYSRELSVQQTFVEQFSIQH